MKKNKNKLQNQFFGSINFRMIFISLLVPPPPKKIKKIDFAAGTFPYVVCNSHKQGYLAQSLK